MFPTLDQAIAQFEGFNTPGSVANRNNNPGNIIWSPFAQAQGATGPDANGFAIFPDSQTGTSALDNLVGAKVESGMTLQQLIESWAPPDAPGNSSQSTANYVQYVSGQTGIAPNQVPTPDGNSTSSSTLGSLGGSIGDTLSGYSALSGLGNLLGIGGSSASGVGSFDGLRLSRIVVIIVGILIIAGGLYTLKPVQQVVQTSAKVGGKIATSLA